MTLKKYIEQLQIVAENNPNVTVYYAVDDEGNAYHPVYGEPTLAHVDDNGDLFMHPEDIEGRKLNAICIN